MNGFYMKKILASLLALGMHAFWGCSYKERCDVTNFTEVEYFWCPKADSAVVAWMPNIKKMTSYYDELADCIRFAKEYAPEHDSLKLCESDALVGKFQLSAGADAGSYKKDSNLVSLWINIMADSDHGAQMSFGDEIVRIIFDIYGCSAYECKNANKLRVYIKEGVSFYAKEDVRITYEEWLTPENFKIVETNSNPPSSSDGYYRYHHFRLIVDSPSIKTTIETRCDSNCYKTWNTPNISFPIGG